MTNKENQGPLIELTEKLLNAISSGKNIKLYNSLGYGRRVAAVKAILLSNSIGVIINSPLLHESWSNTAKNNGVMKDIILISSADKLLRIMNELKIEFNSDKKRLLIFDVNTLPGISINQLKESFDNIIYIINDIDKDPDPNAVSFE
ncbi:MAG: hypothetical protein MJA82_14425 [Clostridia bacterium]|nr:hypothetical protein [Clostridia bacterium]